MRRGSTEGANCAACPFAKDGQPNKPVVADGPDEPKWIAVGESPGSRETREGRGFVGPSGQLVNRALRQIGVVRENETWVTNSTLCQPPPSATQAQKEAARECCKPRLQAELATMPGLPVIALGGISAQGFLGDKFSITQLASTAHDIDFDGSGTRTVIPTIHPAAILRGGDGGGAHTIDMLYWNLVYDFSKVVNLSRGKQVRFRESIETEWQDPVRAEQLMLDMCKEIRAARECAVDTETYTEVPEDGSPQHSALEIMHAKLSAIGLATEERAISVMWHLLTPRAKRMFGAVMADSTIAKYAHNMNYDAAVLRKNGFPLNGTLHDTLLMDHVAFPGLTHGLQQLTSRFYVVHPWKAEYREGDETPEEHTKYNSLDTLAVARLKKPLAPYVKRHERLYEMDLRMAEIARKMTWAGLPLSVEVNADLHRRFTDDIVRERDIVHGPFDQPDIRLSFEKHLAFEQAKTKRKKDPDEFEERIAKRLEVMDKELKKKLKKKGFELDIDSRVHVAAYLKANGVPLNIVTEKGNTSTKKDILEGMAHNAIVRALLDYREVSKMDSTFVRPMRYFVTPDERIHPMWNVNKITGRWSSTLPAVSNLPKDNPKKKRPNLRSQFRAKPGRKIVGADFKALEARIIALLSGDPFLNAIFREGRDLHAELAAEVWKDFYQKEDKERKVLRDLIKRPEYCLAPDAPLWMADGSTKPLGDACVGDEVAAITDSGYGCKATVVATRRVYQPACYRVTTTCARQFIASDEHLWVTVGSGKAFFLGGVTWTRTDELRVGERLARYHRSQFLDDDATRVLAVESVGPRELIALQTSQETYVTGGVCSHNCTFYGGAPETAWQAVVRDYPLVTLDQVRAMVNVIGRKMPGVIAMHDRLIKEAIQKCEVKSAILGRRRPFPMGNPDRSTVLNHPCQSTGADIMDIGLDRLDRRLKEEGIKDADLIIQVHDSTAVECWEDDAKRVKQIVIESLTQEHTYNGTTVLFPVDCKIGQALSDV